MHKAALLITLPALATQATPASASAKPRKHHSYTPVPQTYIYSYTDKNGHMIINNLPPGAVEGRGLTLQHVGVAHVQLAITKIEMGRVLRSPELLAMVDEIATANGVDPWLARAIIQAESAFYDKARSHAGALGLMQLMPATAMRFGVTNPFDPRQNIIGGTKYLKWLMDYFQGDGPKVIAAYNAGEKSVDRYNGVPPFRETRAYVPKVMDLWQRKLVQADPKAAGAMELLKKGRGGFDVEEKVLPTLEAVTSPSKKSPLYQWTDAHGRIQISDSKPPEGAVNIKIF